VSLPLWAWTLIASAAPGLLYIVVVLIYHHGWMRGFNTANRIWNKDKP
jgi:hypothetical protein